MRVKQTSFADFACPIAQTIDRTGEWWSILILRDALKGISRFDDFQSSLGIPPSSLSRRLATLVESGLLEKSLYSDRPARYEYLLTESGRDFLPVVVAMYTWGMKHSTPPRIMLDIADRDTGATVDPVLVDRNTGAPITFETTGFRPGPDAAFGSDLTNLLEASWASRARSEVRDA